MRRLKLSQQIFLIIICILISCCSISAGLVLIQGRLFAQNEMYSRLESLLAISPFEDEDLTSNKTNMEIIYIKGNVDSTKYYISSNYSQYISTEECNELVSQMYSVYSINKLKEGKISYEGKSEKFYYIYKIEKNGEYSILITNSTFINMFMQRITRQTFLLFALIILVACSVILTWSRGLVNRIKKIQTQIINLPAKDVNFVYDDDGEDEIAELGRSVEAMKTQINQTEQIKQEMLQNISHDLKTPIAVIKSYAESIIDGVSDPIDAEIIIKQADNLRNKVNKLLQYNRLEYLSKDKAFESVNIKQIILEVVQTYKYQTPINFDLKLEEVYFEGYRENYYTVIDNIIDNAIRYAKTTIKIILKNSEILIYNDGPHIEEQFIAATFKPYEMGANGQFGLGMSIVKKTLDFFEMKLIVKNEKIGVSFIIKK